jgi:branched-chain amino acid transport system permease protein
MLQILLNGLIEGFAIAVLTLSFGMVYNTLRVFHFAFGALFLVAPYAYFAGLSWGGVLASAVLACIIEAVIYYPLYRRRASLAVSFISSLGVYIIVVNVVALLFGNDTKMLRPEIRPTFRLGSVILTDIQVWLFAACVVLCVVLILGLQRTRIGIWLLAVGENLPLVKVLGGNVRLLRMVAIGIASSSAAVVAILKGMDVGIDPYIGMGATLTAAVAYILSGGKNYYAMLVGAIVLGLIRNLTVWFFSAQWMDAATFLLLVLILLFRQRGLSADTLRVEEA